ncbi:Gfo/Idh/MocA family protein [Nitrosophilus alvini]|uniref:Gfo/Idh/MocA family protein n=1 Tax=Nitrosophilus alvini TaxID=2714855 RepID=UPI00190A6CCC|nr:Gfo/Idh/MocA family oxidoreductase [Nitrosophilus alvini]
MKIAIVGLGVMGKNHYRVLSSIPEARIVGVCDPFVKTDLPTEHFEDIQKMIDDKKPDAVIIATPTFTHKEIALKCIENGVDIFIEKPAASTIEDAMEINENVLKAGIKSAVGHVERFNPVVKALKAELKGKEIYSLDITRVGPFPPRIADVGILTDLAVHDIDLIRFLTDKKIIRKNIFKSKKIHNHHEDNAILSFELEEEVIANITTNWLTPFKKRKIEVATADAYFEADLITQDLVEYSSFKTNNSYVVRNCFVKKEEPLYKELTAFVNYVKNGERGDLATIEDSIRTLELSTLQ